ncbi:MAG: transcription termination/antitermination protein NusA, partial [bacterium]
VGTFVGGRGSRVQAVMANIGEEKIDIIPFDENIERFIANALSPAKNIMSVKTNAVEHRAAVKVAEDQLSLAIGRAGQNVRLAAKLTDWNIDIDGSDDAGIEETAEMVADKPIIKKPADIEDELIAETNELEDATTEEEIDSTSTETDETHDEATDSEIEELAQVETTPDSKTDKEVDA